jgi:4-hydroxythreonine-4-phosphate dehydrogenase
MTTLAIADDLSGAAETAIALGERSLVLLSIDRLGASFGQAGVVVLDLDTRAADPAVAAQAVTAALARVRPADRVFKKIDSLLRGHLAAEIGALVRSGFGVVLTPALPNVGRTVRDGVLRLKGTPLHESQAWRAVRAAPPASVAAALAPVAACSLGLDVVRSSALAGTFAEIAGTGRLVVCDAETDADLDAIALAAGQAPETLALAGSGGLAAAVGRLARDTGKPTTPPPVTAGTCLIVVGTAEPVAVEQVDRLTGFTVHSLRPDELVAGTASILPLSGPTVLRADPDAPIDPRLGHAVSAGLARIATTAVASAPADLVLLGGETARRVLDALGVDALEPLDQIHHGAVRSRTPDGRVVVTRPGSFGDPGSLVRIVRALRPDTAARTAPACGPGSRTMAGTPDEHRANQG